jgi:hypothetical protein
VTIAGLTITGGKATQGGGILNAGTLHLSQDVLTQNVAQGVPNGGNAFGGGLYNKAGTVTIDQSTFTGNQALGANGGSGGAPAIMPGLSSVALLGVGMGGGVWNDGGSVTVTSSSFSGNLAQGGSNGDASTLPSTVQFAIAGTGDGGAIGSGAFFTTGTPTLAIAGSTLSGNQALGGTNVTIGVVVPADFTSGRGGGIGALAGNVSISSSTISNNLSENGALFIEVQNGSIIAEVAANTYGGGIDDEFDLGFSLTFPPPVTTSLSITNSTLSDNVALGNGGSAFAFGGGLNATLVNVQVTNSTVSGNQAIGGPGGGFFVFGGTTFP